MEVEHEAKTQTFSRIHHLHLQAISSQCQLKLTLRLAWHWLPGEVGNKPQQDFYFPLHVPWGCPVLKCAYFINIQWDLISCLHSPYLVAVVTHSSGLHTFISSWQYKLLGSSRGPNEKQSEEPACSQRYSAKPWDVKAMVSAVSFNICVFH